MAAVLFRHVGPEQVGQLVPEVDLPAVHDQINQERQVFTHLELDRPAIGSAKLGESQQLEVIGLGHSLLQTRMLRGEIVRIRAKTSKSGGFLVAALFEDLQRY